MQNASKERIYGIDLHRLLLIFVVLFFHAQEYMYWSEPMPFLGHFSLVPPLTFFTGQFLKYTGQILLFLTFFLMGFRSQITNHKKRLVVVALGILVLSIVQSEKPFQVFNFEWDVLPFVLICYGLAALLPKKVAVPISLVLITFGLFLVPPQFWASLSDTLPEPWSDMFFGHLGEADNRGWALIPWAFPTLAFYAVGRWCGQEGRWTSGQLNMRLWEFPAWTFILVVAGFFFHLTEPFPMGPGYPNHVFGQPVLVFWTNFAFTFFAMRVWMDRRVNAWMGTQPWMRWISSLMWSRHFGICYLTQFLIIPVGDVFDPLFDAQPWTFDLYWSGLFVATELVVRAGFKAKDRLVSKKRT